MPGRTPVHNILSADTTVRRSDAHVGDSAGDPGLLATDGSPSSSASTGKLPLGSFWALTFEDSSSGSEEEDGQGGSTRAFNYMCRSPSPDVTRDLVETSSGLVRRAEKRCERQNCQRIAAREFASSTDKVRSSVPRSSSPTGNSSPARLTVLEPSMFPLAADDVAGWTVVRRLRSSASLDVPCSDPHIQRISKKSYWALLQIARSFWLGLQAGLRRSMPPIVRLAVPRPNQPDRTHRQFRTKLTTLLGVFQVGN
jgi:hypothetical protein